MSVEVASEKVCYVHCNFCNTILADFQNHKHKTQDYGIEYGSSSKYDRVPMMNSADNDQYQMLPIRAPEKRQRVPSAYNRFIKEEIQRIKASNPDISHREAFSAAAKNWAHFPYIHFGLNLDNNKPVNGDQVIASEGTTKSHGFY